MNIYEVKHFSTECQIQNSVEYKGIFEGATEKISYNSNVLEIMLEFAHTNYTSVGMYVQAKVDFSEILENPNCDVQDFCKFAYQNKEITINYPGNTEEEKNEAFEKLTGGDSSYMLPIYNTIVKNGIEHFFAT